MAGGKEPHCSLRSDAPAAKSGGRGGGGCSGSGTSSESICLRPRGSNADAKGAQLPSSLQISGRFDLISEGRGLHGSAC